MIIQWNSNGLHSHKGELQLLANEHNPQYICVQETRLKENQNFNLTNYDIYKKDRINANIASGGVAILARNDSYVEEINIKTSLEAIALKILTPQKLTLCCLYLPPNANITEKEIKTLIDQLPKPFIVLGDYNAHNTLWGSNNTDQRGKTIENITDNEDLIILNDGSPTHFCSHTGNFSAIDLSICDPLLATNFEWETLQTLFTSNHLPIKITHYTQTHSVFQPIHLPWKLENANWSLFTEISKIKDQTINEEEHIDDIVSNFLTNITNAANKAIGKKQLKQKKIVPWWNQECKQAIKENKKALYKYRKHKTQENLVNLKKTQAKLRRTIIKSKKESWQKFVSYMNPNTPMETIWNKIRKIKGGPTRQRTTILKTPTITTTNNQDIANILAKTFENTSADENYSPEFLRHKNEVEKTPISLSNEDKNNPLNTRFTYDELQYALQKSKGRTSPGPDGIPYEMIIHLPQETLEYLLNIYNLLWEKHIYPSMWSQVITIPILKPNKNKTDPTNYRPISLSNCLSKIFQKMVNKRLIWYLESRNILANEQSGFREERSTIDQIINLETSIQNAFRNKQHLIAICFDLQKAYDTTWRYHILKTLTSYDLSGNIMHYIANFLQNRKFKVKTNGCMSEEKLQKNGVPQGEILSVTLFLTAINDITKHIPYRVKKSLFADDLVIYHSGKNIKTIKTTLQEAINRLEDWTRETGFTFSETKTNAIHFCKTRKYHQHPTLKINNHNITYKDNIKFLGVVFDNKLKWAAHIQNLKKECSQRLNIIKTISHTKWGAHKDTILKVYYALIRSKLDYACIIYSTARHTKLKTLETIQNTALRLATGAFRTSPIKSILIEAGEYPLSYRRKLLTLNYITKLAKNPANPTYNNLFQSQSIIKKDTPLQQKIGSYLNNLQIQIPTLQQKTLHKHPPWLNIQPTYILDLIKYHKPVTPAELYQNIFKATQETYPQANYIYTDGSRNSDKSGASIVTENTKQKFRLPDHCSIYTTEIYAIKKATEHILKNNTDKKHTIICSDSISAIQSMKNIYSKNSTIQQIQDNIRKATIDHNKEISVFWIPSHRGIKGNEEADEAAKCATTLETASNTPVPTEDLKSIIKSKIKEEWENDWNNTINNKLREIRDNTQPWTVPEARNLQVTLCRLRIGHTLPTHGYLLQRDDPPICDNCSVPVTVNHIITQCQKYNQQRQTHNISPNIRIALSNNTNAQSNLIKYLTDINIVL